LKVKALRLGDLVASFPKSPKDFNLNNRECNSRQNKVRPTDVQWRVGRTTPKGSNVIMAHKYFLPRYPDFWKILELAA